ncbi:MAG: aminopeptidase YwaD [Marivirga sp.]|jgi:aminopeptidase YwaD
MLPILAQYQESGRGHIAILSSEEFAGRGYVKNGMYKSADYIRKELEKYGVTDAAKNYFQLTPSFPVNTFPDAVTLTGITLSAEGREVTNSYVAGADFLITPTSGDINIYKQQIVNIKEHTIFSQLKSNTAYYLDKTTIEDEFLKKIQEYYIESKTLKNSLLIIYDSSKLTWYPARTKSNNAIVTINIPMKAEQIIAQWKSKLKNKFQGINIIGKVEGKRSDSSIFFSAHYDHLGTLGQHIFPGANDNASGVAMLLDLAKYYAKNQPIFDTYFLFTCAEELGLLGSYYYIQDPVSSLKHIKLLINLDMVGTGDEGITIVNAEKQKKFFDQMEDENNHYLAAIKARGEACNSDHCLFDRAGVPAVFIYTLGGKQAYHDINDNGEGLSLYAYNGLIELLKIVVTNL